jgi:hypothetical protein
MTPAPGALRIIKLAHTVVWALFAGCVLAIPVLTWASELRYAVLCAMAVAVEVLVLAFNRWRCPLTDVAARHTSDRRDNFDIYLPEWLARHNKVIFGTLYVAGLAFLGWAGFSGP